MKYYNGTKLLSLKDLNGKTPEIYMCTTNRTGGKTTYFSHLVMNRFFDGSGKFALIYRYNYELDSIAEKFFKDISALFFPNYSMTSQRRAAGIFHELFLTKNSDKKSSVSCGYAISLNSADQLKKYSHFFSDVDRMLFDEFQSETNHYCNNEIQKFISVHTSIARGQGKQNRYVPVYMISNPVSIINPYYVAMGISERLRSDTKFLRGNGFVLEQGFVQSAADAQKQSGFNAAFEKNDYIAYSSEAVYLNDSTAFIEKPTGNSRYICTMRYKNADYGIREFSEQGVIYCDDRPDHSFPHRLAVTTDDHNINYVMLKKHEMFISNMRYFFERGAFRFKNLKCKECVLKALSY